MGGGADVRERQLGSGQCTILRLLYKYRFGSVELLTRSMGLKSGMGVYRKLSNLCDMQYIGKRYDSSYRLKGLPAAYYLRAKGYRELQKLPEYSDITETIIESGYRGMSASMIFIKHSLAVYSISLRMQQQYPTLKFFTKRELLTQKHFPPDPPDAFLSLTTPGGTEPRRFFLLRIPDTKPRYAIEHTLQVLLTYFDEGGWDATHSPLPTLLLLSESTAGEKRLRAITARTMQLYGPDDLRCYSSTVGALNHIRAWSSLEDSVTVYDLETIASVR